MRHNILVMAIALAMGLSACSTGRKSSSGFHLPDGDVERGRAAFVTLKCDACHRVTGVKTSFPAADAPVSAVLLGGKVPHEKADGELVTSIINPSYRLKPGYHGEEIQGGRRSRMTDYGETMTVRQMIDLVAFLHAHYEVEPPMYAGR